jgi:hypothetical protein
MRRWLLVVPLFVGMVAGAAAGEAPYPRSEIITGIEFHQVPWMSPDGGTLWCVFDRGDHFNLARCTLHLRP